MKTSLLLLLGTLIVSFNSCKRHKPPKAEKCGYFGPKKYLKCNDTRRPKNSQDYNRDIQHGDICTKPESFERSLSFCIDIRTKLIKCENKVKNCK